MYELYSWYKNQPNMWWNKDGNFTPADFLALMLIGEATGGDKELMTAIMTATSNQLWGSSEKHKPYCNDATCEAGIFNFIGTYMQSAGERYNGLISNDGNPSAGTLRNLVAGQEAADKFADQGLTLDQIANDVIYNPISKVYNNDVPTQWGVTGCGTKCEGIGIEWLKNLNSTSGVEYNTTGRCGIYDFYGIGNVQAVVYTNNQLYNWSLENSPCTN